MVIHTLRILLNKFYLILYFVDKIKVFHLPSAYPFHLFCIWVLNAYSYKSSILVNYCSIHVFVIVFVLGVVSRQIFTFVYCTLNCLCYSLQPSYTYMSTVYFLYRSGRFWLPTDLILHICFLYIYKIINILIV